MRSRFAPTRALDRVDQEAGSLASRSFREVAAHGDAVGVADLRQVLLAGIVRGVVPPTEEPHADSRTRGRVDFFTQERVEESRTVVGFRPDAGHSRGRHVGAEPLDADEGAEGIGRRRIEGCLPVEVVFLGRRHPRVRVGRADHPELVGVDADLRFELEAATERGAGEVAGANRGFRARSERLGVDRVAEGLEVGELVGGREDGVGLRVALDLRDLDDGLPLHSGACVLCRDRPAFAIDVVEHQPAADVRVVRDGGERRTRTRRRLFEPGPEVLRFVAVERAVRNELRGHFASLRHEDHTVKILAAGVEVHSQPMNEVKRPGALWRSVIATMSLHTERRVSSPFKSS